MSAHDFKIFPFFQRPRYLTSMGNKTGAKVFSLPPSLTGLWP